MLQIRELNFAEPQIQAFIRLIPAAVAVFDNEMRYLSASDRWLKDYGLTGESIIGRTHYEIFPEIPERWKALHQRCLAGETLKNSEDSFERLDGHTEWLRWELVPWVLQDGTIGGLIMYTEVITAEKEAARTLSEEKARAEHYLSVSGTMILALDQNGRVRSINDSGCRVLGCSAKEIVGRDWFSSFIPVESQERCRNHFAEVLESPEQEIFHLENQVISRTGMRTIDWRIIVTRNREGRSNGILCSGEDVSDARESDRRFHMLSHRNETILNAAGDGIYGVDKNGLATFINPAAADMLGYGADDLIGHPLHDLIHHTRANGSAYPADECLILKAAREGMQGKVSDDVFWRKDGSSFPVEYTATPISGQEGTLGAVVVFRDITDERALQAQLVQSSKMATLGEMATGVAHELNQPLNVIRMAANNVMRKMDKGEIDPQYLKEKLQRISAQTERASAIIDHMRIFGRPAGEKKEALDIPSVVQSSMDLFREQLRLADIDVEEVYPDTCTPVLGHAVQLEQVLLNLLANSRDAVRENQNIEKGVIRISVESGERDQWITIKVADNGGGIDPQVRERIFEPFYTTKEVGKGTGLGLSISYGIITEMGGNISAKEAEGGTEMVIWLPFSE